MTTKIFSGRCIILCDTFIIFEKLFPIWLQKNYRQHIDQVKYSPVTDTPEIILARKNAQLVSKVSKLHIDIIHYQGLITITPTLSALFSCTLFLWALSRLYILNVLFMCLSAKLQSRLWKDQTPVHTVPGPAPNQKCQSQCCLVQWCKLTHRHVLRYAYTCSHSTNNSTLSQIITSHSSVDNLIIWMYLSRLSIRRSGRKPSLKPVTSAWMTWVSKQLRLPVTLPVM